MEYVNMLIAVVILAAAWKLTVELLAWYDQRVERRFDHRHAD